jgi:hypothetical protein
MMDEYSGMLIGGPNDGEPVTASTKMIPVTHTVELKLDGEGTTSTFITTRGQYIWQEAGYYMWQRAHVDITSSSLQAI